MVYEFCSRCWIRRLAWEINRLGFEVQGTSSPYASDIPIDNEQFKNVRSIPDYPFRLPLIESFEWEGFFAYDRGAGWPPTLELREAAISQWPLVISLKFTVALKNSDRGTASWLASSSTRPRTSSNTWDHSWGPQTRRYLDQFGSPSIISNRLLKWVSSWLGTRLSLQLNDSDLNSRKGGFGWIFTLRSWWFGTFQDSLPGSLFSGSTTPLQHLII